MAASILKALPASQFWRGLCTNAQRLYAIDLVNRGADWALLYFWLNLRENNYEGILEPPAVAEQAIRVIEMYPDFTDDIFQWFLSYETLIQN